MVFTNLFFIYLFLPICLLLYFCAKNVRMRNVILLVFSLLFYIWGEPFWILLLLFSSIFNWFMGIQIDRFRTDSLGRKLTFFSVAANILILIGFKYFSVMAGLMSEHAFPLGISIYTLHAISYLLDCSRGSIKPQNRYLLFLMYLSLFPQLTAGPVVRYSELETELEKRRITSSDIYEGIIKFIIGLTKTVLIAGNLYPVVRTFFGEGFFALSTLGTWYVLLVFCLYLYYQFSGYSDMASGIARIFGFHYPVNFDHPFMCRTVTEFWQRWFMTQVSFFRDYMFSSPVRKEWRYPAFFLVWACIGGWFGVSWNGLLWGIFCGIFILLERKIGEERLKTWPVWLKFILSKLIIVISFGILYFRDLNRLGQFFLKITGIGILSGQNALTDPYTWNSISGNLFLLIAAVLFCGPLRERITESFITSRNTFTASRARIVQMILCLILLAVCSFLIAERPDAFMEYWRL